MSAATMAPLIESAGRMRRVLWIGACFAALVAGERTVALDLVAAVGWLAAGLLALALRAELAAYLEATQRNDDLLARLESLLADIPDEPEWDATPTAQVRA